jgi:hypothetical protein
VRCPMGSARRGGGAAGRHGDGGPGGSTGVRGGGAAPDGEERVRNEVQLLDGRGRARPPSSCINSCYMLKTPQCAWLVVVLVYE